MFRLFLATLLAISMLSCDQDVENSAGLATTLGDLRSEYENAPGAPAVCAVEDNRGEFNSDRLLASYEKFYADYDPVDADGDQAYAVVVARKRRGIHTIRVVEINANIRQKRSDSKYVRGFDACQAATDFRTLVLNDYRGIQLAQTEVDGQMGMWRLFIYRHSLNFKLDIQATDGVGLEKSGYMVYDYPDYDETTTFPDEQAALEKRKELMLDYTKGAETKQGGFVIYFFEIAPNGFPFDTYEVKGENSRPWIQGGRWRRISAMSEDSDTFEADITLADAQADGLYIWNNTHVFECGLDTSKIDVNQDGVKSVSNPNELDTDGDGFHTWKDHDFNQDGEFDGRDLAALFGQYTIDGSTKNPAHPDKRDIRIMQTFDKNGDGWLDASDFGRRSASELTKTDIWRFILGDSVFVPTPGECDTVVGAEYFPRQKEGISGRIWAEYRRDSWLEFGE